MGHMQLFSYNYHLGATYTALAWPGKVILMRADESCELDGFPTYRQLVDGKDYPLATWDR